MNAYSKAASFSSLGMVRIGEVMINAKGEKKTILLPFSSGLFCVDTDLTQMKQDK